MMQQPDKAIGYFKQAIGVDNNFAPAYHNLALVLSDQEKFEQAADFARQGLKIDPDYIPLYSAIALALKPLGKIDEAIEYLRKAVELEEGKDPELLSNLASLLFEKGEKEEVKELARKVLSMRPRNAKMHRMLSAVTKYKPGDPHIQEMEDIVSIPGLPGPGAVNIHFALGKAYEDCENYETSFKHYKAANDAHRKTLNYYAIEDENFFAGIKQTFSTEFIADHTLDVPSETMIFIVGMPRSGTSLIEQILASHPDVYGAGELSYLDSLQDKLWNIDRENYATSIKKLTQEDFPNMAQSYLAEIRARAGEKKYITDKMPHNFRYIGLIKCLFPNAKVIHSIREPRDIGVSIFKKYFTGDLPFAYNLKDIGCQIRLYQDLIEYWHQTLPGFIFDLSYTELVQNPGNNVRALLDFCNLDWSDECMNFHKSTRAVTTASTMQVRQPIYKTALDYWKNYEPYIGELLEQLE